MPAKRDQGIFLNGTVKKRNRCRVHVGLRSPLFFILGDETALRLICDALELGKPVLVLVGTGGAVSDFY